MGSICIREHIMAAMHTCTIATVNERNLPSARKSTKPEAGQEKKPARNPMSRKKKQPRDFTNASSRKYRRQQEPRFGCRCLRGNNAKSSEAQSECKARTTMIWMQTSPKNHKNHPRCKNKQKICIAGKSGPPLRPPADTKIGHNWLPKAPREPQES